MGASASETTAKCRHAGRRQHCLAHSGRRRHCSQCAWLLLRVVCGRPLRRPAFHSSEGIASTTVAVIACYSACRSPPMRRFRSWPHQPTTKLSFDRRISWPFSRSSRSAGVLTIVDKNSGPLRMRAFGTFAAEITSQNSNTADAEGWTTMTDYLTELAGIPAGRRRASRLRISVTNCRSRKGA